MRGALYFRLCVWGNKIRPGSFSQVTCSLEVPWEAEWLFPGGIKAEAGQALGRGRWRIKEIKDSVGGSGEVWTGSL